MSDFIFLGFKINVDGDCSHEIKRHLLLGRTAMTNLDRAFKKQRHQLAEKVPYSQGYGFSSSHVWMWTVKKAEYRKINAFELWGWRRLLRVPWTARSNQSILKEINPPKFIGRTDAETEAPILWPPDAKSQLTGKDPDARKD